MDRDEIIKEARAEVEQEATRAMIELHKTKIRLRQTFWVRVFPWRLRLERRDRVTELDELRARLVDMHGHCLWYHDEMHKLKMTLDYERKVAHARRQ